MDAQRGQTTYEMTQTSEVEAQRGQATCLKSHSSLLEAQRGQGTWLRSHISEVEAEKVSHLAYQHTAPKSKHREVRKFS